MATTKPRITISLEEQDYAVLKRLYTLNGVPMSRTVSELVAMLTPVLGRMADNLEAVAKADEETRQKSQKVWKSILWESMLRITAPWKI